MMKKTVLHDEHVKLGAKMTEYAGYHMPVQYTSLKEEHLAVREQAGVFDVSHMGEIVVLGPQATDFLDVVFTNNIRALTANQVQYGFFLYDHGGVVDDLLIYKINDEHYFLVVNAANKDKDFAWLETQAKDFNVEVLDKSPYYSELAIQGPQAEAMLQTHTSDDLSRITFFTFDDVNLEGKTFMVSRTGYTGEDGFEIYGEHTDIKMLFKRLLLNHEALKPCGLGARDTLRFEVALPLYGHEISEAITPLEAGYKFAVHLDKPTFIGKDALVKQKAAGLERRIVGLEILDKGIVREGALVYDKEDKIGFVTTGYLSPSLNKAVALAMIDKPFDKLGTNVTIQVRKRSLNAKVIKKKLYQKNKQ